MAQSKKQRSKISGALIVPVGGFLLALSSGANFAGAQPALPSGPSLAVGSASIASPNSATLAIVQSSQKAVINWQDFSIGAGATVTFQQPGSSAIILNRVTGAGASTINGNLLANGQVWVINGNGILFGQGSRVDVGGLIATTSDIRDSDFLAGQFIFGTPSANPDAGVVNHGSIKAATGGSVVMSAPHVVNSGVVQAKLGQIVLGGAKAFSVDFDGDNLIRYAVTTPVSQAPQDADGKPAAALASNSGTLSAQGGKILMTARAARDVVDNVVNSTGIVEAKAASIQNGEVIFDAGDGGTATLSGTVDVSGKDAGQTGGTIHVLGDKVAVADGARLDASADAGGGTILIGGNLHGAGPEPNATAVTVGRAAIAANAAGHGKGGTIVITSAGATRVAASLSAKGGAQGGDGGLVETSGHDLQLTQQLQVDTSASFGATGLWLLDPADVTVDAAGAANIVSQIATSNVTVQAGNDITVNAPVIYNSVNALNILAGHNVTFNASVENGGSGAIFTAAGWDGVTAPAAILTTPGAYGGNGGSVLIGGAAAGGNVAVASRDGPTTIAARDFALTAIHGYAQLGFGDPGNGISPRGIGALAVNLTGNLSLAGGAIEGSFAQIGHGGYVLQHNDNAPISVTAGGTVTLAAGQGVGGYALIGNGGLPSQGDQSGNVSVKAGGDVILTGVGSSLNTAQIGNSGINIAGTVVLTSGGNITIGPAASLRGNGTGDEIVVAATGNFTNQGGSAALNVSGGGRWLTFLNSPANNNPGALGASPYYNRAFDVSSGSYAAISASGNRFVYALAPVVTIAVDSKTKTYGSANPALTASISGGLAGDAPAGVYTGAPLLGTSAQTGSNAGDYAITGSLGTLVSDFNYSFQFSSGNLHIDPATLTYTAGTASRLYGAANPAFSGTVSGFVNGDSQATATSGTLAFTSPATAASNVGSYAINGSGLTANNGNYNFVQAAGNASALTVGAATLSYVASPASRLYGAANPVFSGTVTGFVNGDTLASATGGSLSFTSPATPASTVGSYAINGSGLTAGNYNFVQAAGNANALTINAAILSYVAGTASRAYGAANPAFSGTVTGFVNGDTQSSVTTGTLTFTSPATAASNVGSYAINGSGLTANNGNYSFAQAAGNASALTINPATLSYVAGAASRVYGAANPAFSGTVTGFVNGDSLASATSGSLAFTSPATAASNVGSYAINGSGLTANSGNYSFAQAAGNASALTINRATLTYVASSASRGYGAANPAFSGSVTGFVNGDSQASATTGALTFTSPATAASNVGNYAINGSGLSAGNYSFVQAAGNASALTINPATLTYAAGSASRAYGAANPAFSGTVTGFANGDTLASATSGSLTFTSAATAGSNVGSYAINGSGLTANSGNYSFAQAAGNASALTINRATLTYVASSASRSYGAANPAFSGSVTGFVNGDSQASATSGSLTFTSAATAASNIGSYAINGSGLSAGNYSFVQAASNASALTINPATLTYAAGSASRAYGAANPGFSGTVTGFANGDTLASATAGSLAFTSPATPASNVGSYAINGSGLTANSGNYNFAQAAGNANALTINPATLTYVANPASRIYGAANPAFSGSVTGFVNGDSQAGATTGALTFASPATATSNVGNYAINGSGLTANNYIFAQASGNLSALTINPATVTANLIGSVTKPYDGTNVATLTAANYNLAGVISGDGLSLNNPAQGLYDSKDVGTGKTVTVNGLALANSANGNYVLTSSSASGAIGAITGTVSVSDLLGNSYTANAIFVLPNVPPPSAPSATPPATSDATSATGADGLADSAAGKLGQSLSGGAQSTTTVLIDGILKKITPPPGGATPHGVPPEEQAYSSWGNEALWQ